MDLRFADISLQLDGQYLSSELADCNDLVDNPQALRVRMERDGYLLVRGMHERDTVLEARSFILDALSERGMLDPEYPVAAAKFNPAFSDVSSTSAVTNEILAQSELLDRIIEGSGVVGFFKQLLGVEVTSFDYRWLRTAGTGAASPIHCDNVFMGRGSENFYTCWTPLCDVSFDMGPLVLCLGSHQMDAITDSYGNADVDRDLIAGHFSTDPLEMVDRFGGKWATTEFVAGDVIVFSRHLLHASLVNSSDVVRMSIDARYQPACEQVDERWRGKNPLGHYAWKDPRAKHEPLAVSRKRWGLA